MPECPHVGGGMRKRRKYERKEKGNGKYLTFEIEPIAFRSPFLQKTLAVQLRSIFLATDFFFIASNDPTRVMIGEVLSALRLPLVCKSLLLKRQEYHELA